MNCWRCGTRVGIAPDGCVACCACGAPSPLALGPRFLVARDHKGTELRLTLSEAGALYHAGIPIYIRPEDYCPATLY